jgi:hypothetical protein
MVSSIDENATASKTKLRMGQEFRPKFSDSEEQPHVKEVNEGSAARWQTTWEIAHLPGEPQAILIHDVQYRAGEASFMDDWNIIGT